jgi:hypothetical protein
MTQRLWAWTVDLVWWLNDVLCLLLDNRHSHREWWRITKGRR